jgi:hypothetical protein
VSRPKRRRARKKASEREQHEKAVERAIAERESEIAEREAIRKRQEEVNAAKVEERLDFLRVDHEARRALTAELTRVREFDLPQPGWTGEDFVMEDEPAPEPVVEGLHYRGFNTLLVAEFKAGKTTLELNLARALADGTPFLGRHKINMPYGNVAFLNYEMDRRQFRKWLRQTGTVNMDRIIPLNLRGWTLPFWEEESMLRLAQWLLENEIGFIIVDPASKSWRGLVEEEGNNIQLAEFFGALDELKRLGDVSNLLISVHKPRAKEDRARGGAEIEAWPDSLWYLNARKEGRTIRASGRDVELKETQLTFDEETKGLTAGDIEKVTTLDEGVERVVRALDEHGPQDSIMELRRKIRGKTNSKSKWIKEARNRGVVTHDKDGIYLT